MKSLDDKGQYLALRCSPYRSGIRIWCLLVLGPTVRSLDLPLVATLSVTGRERGATCTQLDQTR
jgi:hypothetical protein